LRRFLETIGLGPHIISHVYYVQRRDWNCAVLSLHVVRRFKLLFLCLHAPHVVKVQLLVILNNQAVINVRDYSHLRGLMDLVPLTVIHAAVLIVIYLVFGSYDFTI
jgi:hypothetical protein